MASGFWVGATDSTWSTTTNWRTTISGATSVSVVPSLAADVARFNANAVTTARNVYLNGARSIAGIELNSNSSSITLLGGTSAAPATQSVTVSGTFGIQFSAINKTLIFDATAPLVLSGSPSISLLAGCVLTINSVISGVGGAFSVGGSATVTSIIRLFNANTYTGGTTLNLGYTQVNNASAFGSGTLVLGNGKLSSSSTSGYTFTNPVLLSGTMTIGDASLSGPLIFSGEMQVSPASTLTTASDVTLSGPISNTGALTKSGAAGLYFTGTSTTNRPAFTVAQGTAYANSTTALGVASSTAAITVSSGATLSLGAALNYSSPGRTTTINSTGVSTGGALIHAFAGTANVGAITLGSASYIRGTATGTATLSSSILTASGKDLTAGAASGTTLSLTGGISGIGGLTVGFYSSDTGTVALTTSNSYSGNTTLSTYGTLSLGNASALGTSTLIFSGGTLDASTTLTVANALTVSNNITFTGTAALTLSAATVALDTSRTVTVNGSTLTLSGVVSGATFKLTKAGAGVLKLTNTNTYSGGTDIGGTGTVQAGAVQALGSSGTVSLTTSGATLQTLTTGGQNGKLTVAALNNAARGTIKIGG